MTIYGLVPARGGSKSIPNKSIAPLNGKPLLSYTVEAAIQSELIDHVFLSSDSELMLSVGAEYGASKLKRPNELAKDNSPSDQFIKHFIDELKLPPTDTIVLLQPTSPFRNSKHIDEALTLFESLPVIAMSKSEKCIFKAYSKDETGQLVPHFGKDAPFQPRQSFPEVYFPNGSIYIFSVASFRDGDKIPRGRFVEYLMTPQASLDIDSTLDLAYAEFLLQKDIYK